MQNVSKRTILWIVPILILFIFWYMYKPTDGAEYISYIKTQIFGSSPSLSYEETLNKTCENEEWIYFKTNNRQHVVEFKGVCPVDGQEKADINLQFIVEKDLSDFKVGAMLLKGEQQTPEKRDAFLNEVLSSQ